MSDYPQYPSQPAPPPTGPAYGAPAARAPRPAPVDLAVKLLWGAIALSVLGAVLTFAAGGSMIDDQLVQAGATTEQADAAKTMVVVVGGMIALVLTGLFVLLTVFIAKGANWARITTTVLTAIGVVVTLPSLAGIGSAGQPVTSTVVSLVQLLLTVVAVVMLFRPDSNAWFTAR